MLIDAISAELPALRREAEARMVDAVEFRSMGSTTWVDDAYEETPGDLLYAGPCEVQITDTVTTTGENVGEQLLVTERVTIKVPVSVTAISVNAVGTITDVGPQSDPSLVGRQYRVTGSHAKTFATARRLPCELVVST